MPTKEGHYSKDRGPKIDQEDIAGIAVKPVNPDDKWFFGPDPSRPEKRGSPGYDFARGKLKSKDAK
jgi:hypothetical protein